MKIVVDTSVWSLVLRRPAAAGSAVQRAARARMTELISDERITMLGPVRQELLSGIRHQHQFDALCDRLAAWPDEPLQTADHVRAAGLFNAARRAGIAATHTDLLIAATCERLGQRLLTLDRDLARIATFCELRVELLG